jgi:hypothetical protein
MGKKRPVMIPDQNLAESVLIPALEATKIFRIHNTGKYCSAYTRTKMEGRDIVAGASDHAAISFFPIRKKEHIFTVILF